MNAPLFRFRGGVKPHSHKDESAGETIAAAPLPRLLTVPLRQTTGPSVARVVVGQHVLKGERIGAAEGPWAAAVHAPTSGTVRAIEMRTLPHPSGLAGRCVIIEPDGEERWIEREPVDVRATAPDLLREHLRDAGVVGLGGAAFPSHIKLGRAGRDCCEALIINGAECEPWITCDDRLMRERAAGIARGILILAHLLQARTVLMGIEDNKPLAMAAMREALAAADVPGRVVAVPALYPAGGEKQLIRVLTGIEIPYGKLGPDFGVQCFNVGTAHAVWRALELGEPVISRVVTVTGNVERPRNYEVPIGMPVAELLALAGPLPDTDRVLMGGPMMGIALPDKAVPVVKATNCILAASDRLFPPPPPEQPCIRCGRCAAACPEELQPFELYWFARSHNFGKCQEYAIFDCIECGCCAYVCPAHIRLVDYYRYAKAEIRARERDKAAAQAARSRFELRSARLEREAQEKAQRLAAAAARARETAARLAAQAGTPQADSTDKALIEAAMERVRTQQAQAGAPTSAQEAASGSRPPDRQGQ